MLKCSFDQKLAHEIRETNFWDTLYNEFVLHSVHIPQNCLKICISIMPLLDALGYFKKINSQQEKQMCPSAAVLHDITVFSKNRVYFTASILKVQWLAHTPHEIVTFLNKNRLSASSLSLFMLLV